LISEELTVVIPTIGRDSLYRAVESVRSQSIHAAEIIVVDDSGVAAVDEKRLPGCVVLRTTGRLGAAAARNAAMRHAKGDLIAVVDDDEESLPQHLAVALESLRQHPEVDVVSSRALVRQAGVTRVLPTDVYRSPSRSLTTCTGGTCGDHEIGGS